MQGIFFAEFKRSGLGVKANNLNFNIGLTDVTLEKLAEADAFRSIGLDRRQEQQIVLPKKRDAEHVVHDYAAFSLSLKAHPVSFIREKPQLMHILSTDQLSKAKNGDAVKVAGLVLVKQRPCTASGICFITIEDESGCANLVVFENLFTMYRKEILQSKLLMVEGKLQVEGESDSCGCK